MPMRAAGHRKTRAGSAGVLRPQADNVRQLSDAIAELLAGQQLLMTTARQ